MKKIAVVTNFSSVAKLHKDVLEKLFGDQIAVKTYSYDVATIMETIDADVLLISLYSIYVEIKRYICDNASVIILTTTITEEQYQKIRTLPEGSRVLLVNYSPEMTMEALALFRQVGLTKYDFVPVYPGKASIPELPVAVTPGETDKVPEFVREVIDIGHRTLSVETLSDVAIKIGREDLISTDKFISYFKTLKKTSGSISTLLDRTKVLESRFFELLNVIDEGIAVTDEKGEVLLFNKKADEILNLSSNECKGKIFLKDIFENKMDGEQRLSFVNDNYISTQVVPVKMGDTTNGFLVVVNKFDEREKNQHKLRSQLLGKGHIAKYTFCNIIGESQLINGVKDVAKKMAKSDSSVLIFGESGVGKELFAQAIHNWSERRNYQFVAVNCGAIPDTLLESELFGYEEGAFTGAKRGGKAGLFELAHKGTLFLDEIGEMPIYLQSRLLRVIQEKQVMRIGGESIIHVDVRIVAATNKRLIDMVKMGKFRKDLFYRLNVLPLIIPPLRERREDILPLMKNICAEIDGNYSLSPEAESYAFNYDWEGNVRELRNCMEYLKYLDKRVIELEDIKYHVKSQYDENEEELIPVINMVNEEEFVIRCIFNSKRELKGIGRRKIVELGKSAGVYISESDVRRIINNFERKGFVNVKSGRGGTEITAEGIKFLKSFEK